MRKVLLLLGLMMVLFSVSVSADLNDGLVAYYDFEESGGDLIDRVNGHDGIVSGVTYGEIGLIGDCYSFDGSGYIDIPDHDELDFDSEFSISIWVNKEFRGVTETILTKSSVNDGFLLTYDNSGLLKAYTYSSSGQVVLYIPNPSIPNIQWSNIVLVADGSNFKMYLDGIERDSKEYEPPLSTGNNPIRLGAYMNGGQKYVGKMDEVRFWNRGLSPEEVSEVYVLGASDFDNDGFDSILHGGDDCDDTNPNINPDAEEECDGVDNDCDGVIDFEFCFLDDEVAQLRSEVTQLQTQIQQLQQNDNCIFGFIEKIWEFIFGEPMPSCSAGGGGVGEIGGDTGDAGGDVTKGKKK